MSFISSSILFLFFLAASKELSRPFIVDSFSLEPAISQPVPPQNQHLLLEKVFCFSFYKPQWHPLEKLFFCDNFLTKVAFQLILYYDYLLYFGKADIGRKHCRSFMCSSSTSQHFGLCFCLIWNQGKLFICSPFYKELQTFRVSFAVSLHLFPLEFPSGYAKHTISWVIQR